MWKGGGGIPKKIIEMFSILVWNGEEQKSFLDYSVIVAAFVKEIW